MSLSEGKTLVETYREIIAELETMGGDMDACLFTMVWERGFL